MKKLGTAARAATAIALGFALLIGGAAAMDFDEDSRRLADEYQVVAGGEKSFDGPGSLVVLDYLDLTGGGEPRIGGETAALGRYLRNVIAGELYGNGIDVVEADRVATALKRMRFTAADVYDDERVLALLGEFPEAGGIVTGEITASEGPSVLHVETTLRRREGDELVPQVGMSTLVLDGNAAAAAGLNIPPLSDSRPNLILRGHPFLDPAAPFRVEIVGRNGVKPLRFRNAQVYVEGETGDDFSIRLINNSGRPAAVSVFVDGLPVNTPAMSSRDVADKANVVPAESEKLVVRSGEEFDVGGWRDDAGKGGGFAFSSAPDSAVSDRAFWDGVGLISVVFYDAGEDDSRGIWDVSDDEDSWVYKEIPGGGSGTVATAAKDADGRAVSVRHSRAPVALFNIRYDIPERVRNYSLVGGD